MTRHRAAALALVIAGVSSACSERAPAADANLTELSAKVTQLEAQQSSLLAELQASRDREEALKQSLAPLEDALSRYETTPPPAAQAEPDVASTGAPDTPASSAAPAPRTAANDCRTRDTGNLGFDNSASGKTLTVVVYYQPGSDRQERVTVQPGGTGFLYDFPAGSHNYVVTYRGMTPIMSFPPGAPLMEAELLFSRGQLLVQQCGSQTITLR